ncbi:tRNA 2-thiouridine(34) synthase MnmA [Acidocella aminolytica]|jgi:tRNA-specific 2-thiouridylase|uniref:tRNA-specific 2-thiouridylase MnmA n=1 Tax=Acidocella aminolytica 101 = DSM 11237 TaxID=1120923 RepID=A0A0D6PGB0_9PROT|nr:tRNA 2-thiouridine(34) synthase MnmA [Acidocella aminolytica]GAN80238.1 tRNA-specific 2-thiouridylase MnmA [Acidocella aminolytica 101 = DSM 11237]GBQ44594.1 tRNA-specific 2-thiouridylase MnmA [Acidocella aminolytica 101 = DSM 11237]SHE92373.1 tRNA (5-methylaminomethyl-2-thiouridylate)-methyltransferase [Acidocella aminolytica 101 = DSM 11237]
MKVVVAMSGGVDSSVVAGLMAREGHEVIGVTLQLYDHGAAVGRKGACCAGQDIHDAKRVADRLGIAHYVIDSETRFKDSVISAFADAYAQGETPVPCIACNQHLKFGDLLEMAKGLGADALATGHYVRRLEGPNGAEMHKAVDETRDQSWFLFATTQEQLDFCRFPLGAYASKAEVRVVAAEMGLAVAEKADSQDICFVPSGTYVGIVEKLRPDALEEGEVVSEDGRVLGTHQGIARYTIGQAKRLPDKAAHMVVKSIEPGTKRIVVGPRGTQSRIIRLRDVNWLTASEELRASVKLRARDSLRAATIRPDGQGAMLELEEPALAAPGQAAVFYEGSRILGGGFII